MRSFGSRAPALWYPGLDGLRALAVVAVIVFHFRPAALPGGFLGVDLFFVISGYLITRLLLAEIDRCGNISLADFYRRRARRLLPAVLTLLGVVALAGAFVWRDALPTLRGAIPASLGYVTNWWLIGDHQSYFVATGRPPMLQHLWSLAIEEQFYLLWPVTLILLLGVSLRQRRITALTSGRLLTLAGVATLLAVASGVAMAVIAVGSDVPYGADSGRVYFGTDTHAMGLLLGAAAGALAVRARFSLPKPVLRGAFVTDLVALWAGIVLVGTVLSVNEFSPGLYRGGFLAVSALCALVVAAVPRRGSVLGWLLDRAPLRWIGQRSYALYLWHWPVAVVTRPDLDIHAPVNVVFALRLLITVLLADVSYRFIERPIRTGGADGLVRTWRINRLEPATRARLAPTALVGLLVLLAVSSVVGPTRAPAQAQVAAQRSARPATSAEPATDSIDRPTTAPHYLRQPQAAPRLAPRRPSLAVSAFGDSVMLGAAPELRRAVARTVVSAVEGRQARAVFADIARRKRAHQLAPVVVIHTGDNGIISPDDLDATLRSLSDRRRVVLITDRVARDWQDPNNQTLRHVGRRFRNVVVLDWNRRSAAHRAWFWADGLHLRPAGACAYAALIAAQIP